MTFGLPYIFWRLLAAGIAFAGMLVVTCWGILPAVHVARPYSISSAAMSPTVNPGDVIFSYEMAYDKAKPQRGDIIAFSTKGMQELEYFDDSGAIYLKRVAGLPGETISIQDHRICVNDKPAAELAGYSYDTGGKYLSYEDETYLVPPGSYFVLGDNSSVSGDSRYWGCVPAENLRGRAVLRVWPPWRIGLLR